MKILIACEKSGVTKRAFQHYGHQVFTCDELPSEDPENHLQCDVRDILDMQWDMMICHPPIGDKELMNALANAPVPYIAIENPPRFLPPTWIFKDSHIQHLSPFMFNVGHLNASALWLKGLPQLQALKRNLRVVKTLIRRTGETDGILATQMAKQWSNLCVAESWVISGN